MPGMVIADVLTVRPCPTLRPWTSVDEAIRVMRDFGYSELPVLRGRYLDCVVTEGDLAAALLDPRDPTEICVGELVPEHCVVGRRELPLVEALMLLVRHRLQRLAVVGDGDEFLGMVSSVDVSTPLEHSRLQEVTATALATHGGERRLRLIA